MSARIGVVVFPGTNCEADVVEAVGLAGGEAELLWHGDADLRGADAVVLPGGFAHGDYLRVGALARFSPVMGAVAEHALAGGPVVGICNGFQVLCEAGLLPGALLPNLERRFLCRQLDVEVVSTQTAFTTGLEPGELLSIPVKHQAGRYFLPPEQQDEVHVAFRYAHDGNPNGSTNDVAGVANVEGNVVGLMPHPEHAVDPLTGSADGLKLFEALHAVRV